MTHAIMAFLKFGNLKNMTDLFENGTVYMNTVQYFKRLEDEELRGDKYEGATMVINSLPGKFTIPSLGHEVNFQKVHLIQSKEQTLGNIYSLYSISSHGFPNPVEFMVSKKNKNFGSHCVMIKDVQYFLDSVERELAAQGIETSHGFIEYYDKNIKSGHLSLFDKPNEFEYQKEFRFYIESETIKPISIKIGSLQGKAELISMEDAMTIQLTN